ncbi:MAG TPA: SRPBCC domain-containing protein [Burkholderiaceae bacterium]|nr:SRPBCC domain-containing protein [Burkholderiaceae bacterium]
MNKTTASVAAVAACLLAGAVAHAETSDVSASGFTITYAMVVDADPQKVYQAFMQLPKWWNSAHSWSGQASNMSLDAQAGGCWCERWGDGASAMHGRVLLALPGSALRLQAWLGPLQEIPNAGVLAFGTARRDGATRLRVTYRVAGAPEANLDKLAPAVDGVIGEQVKRLKAFIETGKPD